jgi:hypothetical protein
MFKPKNVKIWPNIIIFTDVTHYRYSYLEQKTPVLRRYISSIACEALTIFCNKTLSRVLRNAADGGGDINMALYADIS